MQLSLHRNLSPLLLLFLAALLLVELTTLLPSALAGWHPYGYWRYTEMGRAVLAGQNPFVPGQYYPLPTVLWAFVPLALLPDWFRLVWIILPFAACVWLHKRAGLLLLLFPPLWIALSGGAIDANLIVPLAMLLADGPRSGPVGAVLLLLKPQLALLAVSYKAWEWLALRQWRKLALFGGGCALLVLPSFVVWPAWPMAFLGMLPSRAKETLVLEPTMTSSLWGWWGLDSPVRWIIIPLVIAGGVLFWRAWRIPPQRAAALIVMTQFLGPIFFASSLVILLPLLKTQRQIVIVTALALCAYALDTWRGLFGGGYAFVSLAVLYFLQHANSVSAQTGYPAR